MEDVAKILESLNERLTRTEWEAVRRALDWVVRQKRYSDETEVDKIEDLFGAPSIYWLDILRKLQDAGVGRLILGRKGAKSRFRWGPATVEIAEAMAGAGSEGGHSHQTAARGGKHVRLPLEGDRLVELRLPADLTEPEAKLVFDYLKLVLKQA